MEEDAEEEESHFEVRVRISRTKTDGLQRYGQCWNGYVYDGRSTVNGGTAAGLVLQLLLRGAVSIADVVEDDAAFLHRQRRPGSDQEEQARIEVQLEKPDEFLFSTVSKHGGFMRGAKRSPTIRSLCRQFSRLYDIPAACTSPRSSR